MVLVVVGFLALVTLTTAGPLDSYLEYYDKSILKSSDSDCHPECPCYYNGIFYDNNDRWSPKDDPCIMYLCKNGYYTEIMRACNYKGECKLNGTTWTESCMTYRCNFVSATKSKYTMVEGACETFDGSCLDVGQRTHKRCDTYECQVVEGCYEMVLVSKGKVCMPGNNCQVSGCYNNGGCQKRHSFWQENCDIYQCVQSGDTSKSSLLHKERMYWPKGNYSLIAPTSGCPVDIEEAWSTGHRIHLSDGSSSVSESFHLAGKYMAIGFEHEFCTHTETNKQDLIPLYQTYFDEGCYCIMRRSGRCPLGFEEGYVSMVDRLLPATMYEGDVPDGNLTGDTGFYFCCRCDGHIEEPIVLPRDEPFVLFMVDEAPDCQSVLGMEFQKEYFEFDDVENTGRKRFTNGSIPMMKDCDNNTLIYYCYYTPLSCGCKDDDGKLTEIGQTYTTGCVTYKCRNDEDGKSFLEIEKGGCKVDDDCKQENGTWTTSVGDKCMEKMCVRERGPNGKFRFTVKTTKTGCRDDDKCRSFGDSKTRGCYQMVCSKRPLSNEPYFKLTKSGCSDGNNNCIPIGKNYTVNCIVYKCSTHKTNCGGDFVKGMCRSPDNTCIDVDSLWESPSCTKYRCNKEQTGNSITFKLEADTPRCRINGKCYDIGENAPSDHLCYSKKCVAGTVPKTCGSQYFIDQCPWRGKCKEMNSTWVENCVTYRCSSPSTTSYSITIEKIACPWKNGTCIDAGSTTKEGCTEKVCNVKKLSDSKYSRKMDYYSFACTDPVNAANCISLNNTIYEKCVTYNCTKKPGYFPSLMPIKADCLYQGTCKSNKAEWLEEKTCVTKQCSTSISGTCKVSMSIRMVDMGCKDGSRCRYNNQEWSDGTNKKTCTVIKKGTKFSARITSSCLSCKMPDGKLVRVGSTYEKHCIMYKCIAGEQDKDPQLRPVEARCMCSNKCRPNNEEWVDKHNCVTKKCVTSIDEDFKVTQEIKYLKADCKDGNICRPANIPWMVDCTKRACTTSITGRKLTVTFHNISAGCMDPYGDCVSFNYTYQKDCVTYQCSESGDFVPVDAGCTCTGVCVENGAEWRDNKTCAVKKCEASVNANYSINMKTSYVQAGCRVGNLCRDDGETWDVGCSKKTCSAKITGNRMTVKINTIPTGCWTGKGMCYEIGFKYKSRCITYQCVHTDDKKYARVIPVDAECSCSGVCTKNGTIEEKNCISKQCITSIDEDYNVTARTIPVNFGCKLASGQCIQEGESDINCVKQICSKRVVGNSVYMSMRTQPSGCMVGSTCYKSGDTWIKAVGNACARYMCSQYNHPVIDSMLCMDKYKTCHEVGKEGFPVMHGSKEYKCDCVRKNNIVSYTCRG